MLAEVRLPGCVADSGERAERIRVRGLVQGVGFRPTVWRLAQRHGLRGSVANDGDGVSIHVCGAGDAIDAFVRALSLEAPPLARVDRVAREAAELLSPHAQFAIRHSTSADGPAHEPHRSHTGVVPDAATCTDCLSEVLDPNARRYRYPFANCTHCGPRLTIVEAIPYDRERTTLRGFSLCADCAREYADCGDRRFHAQAIACPACGPRAWLERADGERIDPAELTARDAVDATAMLLRQGHIVAIKGLGGFQLACDAGNAAAVARLRDLKRRERKPFALMVRNMAALRKLCHVDEVEAALLRSPAAPIVVLDARVQPQVASGAAVNSQTHAHAQIATGVAPGLNTLGVMLPNTPLHHLLLGAQEGAIVLTSGNLSDEPQCVANDEARSRLGGIASHFLMHDRDIARRVDDSLQRVVAGVPRSLRRARGYAPATLLLPPGFESAPAVLALGGELKNTFCLLRSHAGRAEAIVSHHIGDLENAATHADFTRSVADYQRLFEQRPQRVAIDLHPGYLSSQWGAQFAQAQGLQLDAVQHHHAHIAACMAENGVERDHPPVLGVALDGLGVGDDGKLWGGEFLLCDYSSSVRLASLQAMPLLGGAQAMRQPWRNAYAHLVAGIGWQRLDSEFAALDIVRFLAAQPRAVLDAMLERGVNSPAASSCGRLFDAVAAAAGVCRDHALYEGQAAIEFEALIDRATLDNEDDGHAYAFGSMCTVPGDVPRIDAAPMWHALLTDLARATPVPLIAARFHKGLAIALVRTIFELRRGAHSFDSIALSGGVLQNRVLLEQLLRRLAGSGLRILTHREVPTHDGGLALGQAVIAAARALGPVNPH